MQALALRWPVERLIERALAECARPTEAYTSGSSLSRVWLMQEACSVDVLGCRCFKLLWMKLFLSTAF
jgi:hypothetical protein